MWQVISNIKMIKVPILTQEIERAKELTSQFDTQKNFNKYECKNNYLGVLGEIKFNQLLQKENINHRWIGFIKQNWDEPDFIIGSTGIDIKTTFGFELMIQTPKFDLYIFSRVNQDLKEHLVIGGITKASVERLINNGSAEKRQYSGQEYYFIKISHLVPIEELITKWKK